jgi:hypothetical protein
VRYLVETAFPTIASGVLAMAQNPNHETAQPRIEELMARFLKQQADDRGAGIPELPVGEVEPYEAAFAPPVEPRTALEEAAVALKLLSRESVASAMTMPPDWSTLAASSESLFAIPLASGSFPQLLRDLPALIRAERKSSLRREQSPVSVSALARWARVAAEKHHVPQALMGAGALRLAGQYDTAEAILFPLRGNVPETWRLALENEVAALSWVRGRTTEAEAIWSAMPRSAVTCFNRGMAALFADRSSDAKALLKEAVALLPDDSTWQHLANLYLALAGT